jgi:ligand-binding sensor domain-containing protein
MMAWSAMVVFLLLSNTLQSQLPAPSFYHLKRDINLFSSNYYTIAEDPYGFIWFGSHAGGGLYRFDGYDLMAFQAEPNRLHETISGSRISGIYFGPDSLLYIGTSFGFTRMDPETGRLKNFNNVLDSLPDSRAGSASSFYLDSLHQILWVGSLYGLIRLDMKSDVIKILRPQDPVEGHVPEAISRIIPDPVSSHILWLGTYNGLFSYNTNSGSYTYYPCPDAFHPDVAIYDMYMDPSPSLWMTTNQGSILQFIPSSTTWKEFNPSPDVKKVYGLLPVNENEYWLSCESSVGRFNIQDGLYHSWQYSPDYPDGLLHNGEYRDLLNDRHGRLWVASWHGIQYAKHAMLPKSNRDHAKVAITSVDIVPIFEEKQRPLIYTEPLHLQRQQRDVTFKFVLPNPLNKDNVQYQYMLAGYDNDWITTDQRSVRYSKLPGGEFSFKVRGREGNDPEWVPSTELVIQIDKRMSELWWFWAALVLVAGLVAVLIYHWLVSKARKEERLKSTFENKLSEIQMQALRAQMNPHFLFNSLNSIKYFAITKSKDETASYLSKFALLVRSILNNSKSRTISLKDELEALKLYIEIEHLRLEGKFDYKIEIDNSIHISQAQIPPMILQPYVENAIWHGLMHKEGKGFLLVQVKDMGDQIQCVIEDNGIGRERAAEIRASRMDHKSSVGMQITSDRIALINKIYDIDTRVNVIDLADEDGNPGGTRVVIHVPLIQDEEE